MTNVALVVLDTLRKDYFDEHFDWLPGEDYDDAWSTSHWTVPAHASLFTGKYPSEVGCTKKSKALTPGVSYLPQKLQENGYTTRAFSANVYLSWHFGYDRGFDEFKGNWRVRQIPETDVFDWQTFIGKTRGMGPERFILGLGECLKSDKPTLPSIKHGVRLKANDAFNLHPDAGAKEALSYVCDTDFGEQEFLFLNLMEAHTPYDPPEEYQSVEPPQVQGIDATLEGGPSDGPNRTKTAYDDCVRYLSDVYKQIFEQLQEDFDIVVTMGDHGELLGEHDAWGHWYGLYPEMTHVPLSVWGLDGAESKNAVSILDVHETVASITGVEMDSRGEDLRESPNRPFLTEYHGISPRHIEIAASRGFDLEPYDKKMWGVVSDGEYAYEGFESFHGSEYDEQLIEELRSDVDVYEGKTAKVNKATLSQLKDLGYA